MIYVPPKLNLDAFNCPHCYAYTHQKWLTSLSGRLSGRQSIIVDPNLAAQHMPSPEFLPNEFTASQCIRCNKFALWYQDSIVYPNATTAPLPEEDMPADIKKDFEQAREVFPISAPSSAALLRLVIQKLSSHLGYSAKTIDQAIGKMVADGIHPMVQQAFDVVRVIGNESVHPGQIDLRDDPDTALQLFKLVNIIVEEK